MKKLYMLLLLLLAGYNASSQYLGTDTFEFDINEEGYARLWSHDYNHTVMDLSNDIIDNEYYVFVDGNIYEVDEDYENLIGTYTSKSITIYGETYTLQKPLLGKLSLKNEATGELVKIKTTNRQIIFEPTVWEIPDVLKLWACQKGIRRILNKEETTVVVEGFFNSF
ncbi:hypothetical protein QW060_21570 [Myroides ceti]|uniref:Uncharacterized protein n=1 Tax=Paenimyroides ceti TaxID=395087 RepID=A0ABT8CYD3_9FLAO|nr:hypothetical protein [Paenimyroides ceti]MDN3708480.1 hypothetical protein [Paenimyroides ceti]MDN3709565.1 hypothetical protein [Paenimyroides ceti]